MKILVFGSTGCGGCKLVNDELTARESELTALSASFEYINLSDREDAAELKDKYNLMSAPTILIVEGEQIFERYTGYVPADALIDDVKELLK